ncbi:MAG: hypothetical protein ACJ72D_27085 [Marmoricola sp.]
MTVLRLIDWRRAAPVVLPVAIALPMAYLGRWSEWAGVWSETQAHLGAAFIFALPVAAAAGAWVGASDLSSGLDDLRRASGRHELVVSLRACGEPAGWAIVGLALGSVPALVATEAAGPAGHPSLLPALLQASCAAGACATGGLVGRRLPWRLGAPLVAVVAYVGLGAMSFNAESLLVALTPVDDRWAVFFSVRWWVLVLQAAFWVLVLAQVVARRAGRRGLALLLLFVAGLAVAPVLAITPDTRVTSESGVVVRCAPAGNDVVCLPQAKELVRRSLVRNLATATGLLRGLLPGRGAYIDDEARGSSRAADVSIARAAAVQDRRGLPVTYLSRIGDISAQVQLDRPQFQYNLIAAVVPYSGGEVGNRGAGGFPVATASDAVTRWYLERCGLPLDGTGAPGAPYLADDQLDFTPHAAEYARFEAMNASQRSAWFARYAPVITGGRLTWSDVGAGPP